MNRRVLFWGGAAVAVLGAMGGAWMLSLPPAPAPAEAPSLPQAEADAIVAALKPPKRERPLVAVIGINDATEATDYLMVYGVLRRSGVADVMLLATQPGPVTLFPALTVEPHATVAEFDARFPDGPDYVIVPAVSRDDDPAALAWIRAQASKGSIIVGVCAGAKVVADAGLLDGRRGTTHWYYLDEMLGRHPSIDYVRDRRMVVDRGVATTTGITASMPMALTLLEAIAGRAKAEAVAHEVGLDGWDARHASSEFRFSRPFAKTVLANVMTFWKRETFGIELRPGIDEVSLALVADAWSRTYRSRALTFSASADPVESRNGVRIRPDRVESEWPGDTRITTTDRLPAHALDETLHAIAARYGSPTMKVVMMQLEYPARTLRPAAERAAIAER